MILRILIVDINMKSKSSKRFVTRQDVAKLAGVSHMTVTRALNHDPAITEATRRKVLEACTRLSYRRNLSASALRNNHTFALGVVVPTLKHNYYGRLLAVIEKVARERGYYIVTIQANPSFERPHLEWTEIDFLLARQVDGLLLAVALSEELEIKLAAECIPKVFFDSPPHLKSFDFVGTDNEAAMFTVTNELIQRGHSKIAFIGGFADSSNSLERIVGWRHAMKSAGLDVSSDYVCETGFSFEAGKQAVDVLRERGVSFTALVSANDYVAMGACSALREYGLHVPRDVAVTGMAGEEVTAYFAPPLTTMVQPVDDIARYAVERLIDRIAQKILPYERKLFPAELLSRGSW